MKKVVAIVGMAGSGKSEVSRVFESHGFVRIRFGDITDEEMKKKMSAFYDFINTLDLDDFDKRKS